MSFASRLGYSSRDPKLKVVETPVVQRRLVASVTSPDLAVVARLQAELKAANARIVELEAQVALLSTVTPITGHVTKAGNALTPAEKQRAYRERQKAKKANARQS